MERSFRADFSDVRVHQGDAAPAMGALAFTQGSDIHFATGQYDPESRGGRDLLGHELAHVVQQREGRVSATRQSKGVALNDDSSLEREADAMGAAAAAGDSVRPHAGAEVRRIGSAPAQRLVDPAVNEGAPLDIDALSSAQCRHYLEIWESKQNTSEVKFTEGDVPRLRSRLGSLGGRSILEAILRSEYKVAIELCMQFPSFDALMQYEHVNYIRDVFKKVSPIGCGQTAVALSKLFLGGDGARVFAEIHAVSLAKNDNELGLGDLKSEHEGEHDALALGVLSGTTGELGSLAALLERNIKPLYVQFQVASNPRALGHAYVIEVFAREDHAKPIIGMLHQSYIGKYYLFDWINQQQGATIDVLGHLVRLKSMCETFDPDSYAKEYLTRDEQGGFLSDPPQKGTKLGVAFSATPFDFGRAQANVVELLETRKSDIQKTTSVIEEERQALEKTARGNEAERGGREDREDEKPTQEQTMVTRTASVMDLWTQWEGFKMGDRSAKPDGDTIYTNKIDKQKYRCTGDNGTTNLGAKRFTFTPV